MLAHGFHDLGVLARIATEQRPIQVTEIRLYQRFRNRP